LKMDVTSAPVTLEQVRLNCTLVYRETLLLCRAYAKAVLSQVGQVDGNEHLIHICGISRVELSSCLFYLVLQSPGTRDGVCNYIVQVHHTQTRNRGSELSEASSLRRLPLFQQRTSGVLSVGSFSDML